VWDACIDPDTLSVAALPVDPEDDDRFDPERFSRWLMVVTDARGREHAVLSDGYRRIRIDISEGSLVAGHPVMLHFSLTGVICHGMEARVMPLRRLGGLLRTGRFLPSLFPEDRRLAKMIAVLRVADALKSGASQREIAVEMFGEERIPRDWRNVSDSLRSRVRRLVRTAGIMSAGGYRRIMRWSATGED
jgi:hypothetical protein